jgi:hypothetical protein
MTSFRWGCVLIQTADSGPTRLQAPLPKAATPVLSLLSPFPTCDISVLGVWCGQGRDTAVRTIVDPGLLVVQAGGRTVSRVPSQVPVLHTHTPHTPTHTADLSPPRHAKPHSAAVTRAGEPWRVEQNAACRPVVCIVSLCHRLQAKRAGPDWELCWVCGCGPLDHPSTWQRRPRPPPLPGAPAPVQGVSRAGTPQAALALAHAHAHAIKWQPGDGNPDVELRRADKPPLPCPPVHHQPPSFPSPSESPRPPPPRPL